MADTSWNSSLTIERWSKKFFKEARVPAFFEPFTGEGEANVIQVKTELEKSQGDQIHFGLIEKLTGTGVTGDNTMAGNEKPLQTREQSITIDQLRQGIISEGRVNDKKTHIKFRQTALDALKVWFSEEIDSDLFTVLSASPTRTLGADAGGTPRIDSASKSGLAAADKISLGDVSLLKAIAQRPYTSGDYKIRPIKIKGKPYYMLIIGTETAYDLKRDSEWAQAMREAQARGNENPLFSGSLAMWDGVVIHEHENITQFDNGGGASVHGEVNLFLGAQAGLLAFGGDFTWHEEKVDRGNKLSITGGIIYEAAKAKFNSIDWATIAYYTASTDLSA